MRWSYGILLVLVVAAGVTIYVWHNQKLAEEAEANTFAEDAINAISAKWDPQEFIARAEPGLVDAMTSHGQSVDDLFHIYKQLGAPKSAATCEVKNSSFEYGRTEDFNTVTYNCLGSYENGEATIDLTLHKGTKHTEWQIYYIHINSPAFTVTS